MTQPGVKHGSEAESDARACDGGRHAGSVQVDRDAELFEYVCGPTGGRGGAVAMLDDRAARPGHHNGRHRRDVGGMGLIAPSAH